MIKTLNVFLNVKRFHNIVTHNPSLQHHPPRVTGESQLVTEINEHYHATELTASSRKSNPHPVTLASLAHYTPTQLLY